jgi:hypothetical protein
MSHGKRAVPHALTDAPGADGDQTTVALMPLPDLLAGRLEV